MGGSLSSVILLWTLHRLYRTKHKCRPTDIVQNNPTSFLTTSSVIIMMMMIYWVW